MSQAVDESTEADVTEEERQVLEQMTPDDDGDPDEPDGQPTPDGEPEPNLPPQAPSDKAAERAITAIERAGDTYSRKVQSIQATTDLGLVECPLCPVPGFVSEMAPPDGFDPQQVAVVLAYLGIDGPQEYRRSPHLTTCPDCDGLGFWSTGSKRDGKRDVMCDTCMGNGYVDRRQEQAMRDVGAAPANGYGAYPPTSPNPGAPPAQPGMVWQGGYEFAPAPGGSPDPWGRLAGHPLWGAPIEQGGV